MPAGPIVGHVNLAKGFRGGERQTQLLIQQLADQGWRQRLVTRRGSMLGARCQDIDGLNIVETSSNAVSAARKLRGVDIAHIHEGRAVYAGLLAKLFYGIPFIITRRIDNPFRKSIARNWAYNKASVIAGVSSFIVDQVSDYYPHTTVVNIADAHADLTAASPDGHSIRARYPDKMIAGHIGALVQSHKGQMTIIDAAKMLQDTNPNIHFMLIGSGLDEAMFKQSAEGLANISFEGQVDNVADFLDAFDVFVFPSLKEGLGSTLLDAMCFGLPVVASGVGGIPDIIEDGVNGLLVPPGDVRAFTEALLRVQNDDQLRARMKKENLQKAGQFSAAVMAESYGRLYRGILS